MFIFGFIYINTNYLFYKVLLISLLKKDDFIEKNRVGELLLIKQRKWTFYYLYIYLFLYLCVSIKVLAVVYICLSLFIYGW